MTTTETGKGFAKTTVDARETPGPCTALGSPTVGQVVPSMIRVHVGFRAGTKALLAEVLSVYSDAATAERALDFEASGLDCTSGTLHLSDGTNEPATIEFDGSDKAFDAVTVDRVSAWTATTSTTNYGLIVARIGNALAELELASRKGVSTAELRNGELIVADALRRVKAAR
jgi:hypothetical protein